MNPGALAVLFIFGFPFLLVGGFFLIWALKIVKGEAVRRNEQFQSEETRLIQELHQGLTKMEKRIEVLETIILDTDRKDDMS
jgi:hypothetical protein